MSGFGALVGQSFVVKLASPVGVEAQVELILTTKLEACLGEGIIPELRSAPSLGQVRRVRRDLVTDDACTDILFVGKTEVLFGSYVAEHCCPVPTGLRRADRAGDVLVTGV